MDAVDAVALAARELLRERAADLIGQACAWSVGLSDSPHYARRHGRVQATGSTLGERALADLQLGSEEDGRLDLVEAPPGTFRDALNALTTSGALHADRFDEQVLAPFVLDTCVRAAEHVAAEDPQGWAELLDDLGEDGSDVEAVVRGAEWETALRTDAEQVALSALGDAPLVEVEAEGLPLSVVQAAEAETRRASTSAEGGDMASAPQSPGDLSGALFLAEVALREGDFDVPVPSAQASDVLAALLGAGLQAEEVLLLLPRLPLGRATAEDIATEVRYRGQGEGR